MTERFKVRVRLGPNSYGQWTEFNAFTAQHAAEQLVARDSFLAWAQLPVVGGGGVIPVEVAPVGTAAVERFTVSYSVRFKAEPA